MKRIFCLFLLLGSVASSYAQDNFTLSLELVNPSGKVDSKSYFLARLKNHNDSLSFFIAHGGGQNVAVNDLRSSYFRVIADEGDSEYVSDRKFFFDYGEQKYVLIAPSSEYQVRLPLFVPWINIIENGILPFVENALSKIRKVRIKLENFEILPMKIGSLDPKYFYPKKSIDLYSNWVKIDAAKFVPLLKKHSREE